MPIPEGKLYQDGNLGAGTVATLEPAIINSETAGADINFGTGVTIEDGKVVPATKGKIFGVALKRTYSMTDNFDESAVQADHWYTGETFGVLRDGTISVPISSDVDVNDMAAVDADGKFKTAGTGDEVVGVFLSAGNEGSTANMQTRIQFGTPSANSSSTKSTSSTDTGKDDK